MSILIGFKKQSSSGAFHGVHGLEGFSMEATSFNILKEGDKESLETWISEQKLIEKSAQDRLDHLVHLSEIEDYTVMSLTENQWEAKLRKYREKLILCRYDKLMILEGTTIDSKL